MYLNELLDIMHHIEFGYIDIPKAYNKLPDNLKKMYCDKLINGLYKYIDDNLDENENRIEFLHEVLESSEISNADLEQYEIAAFIRDCRTRLNED
jgi:ferritin-like metal-binding protein YciE